MYNEIVIGSRVKISSGKYHYKADGLTGTVKYLAGNTSIGVLVDGISNAASSYGYFYFPRCSLALCVDEATTNKKGDNSMTADTTMDGAFRIAVIHFLEGSNTSVDYLYACYDNSILEKDKCVVRTGHHGFAVAQVIGFIPKEQCKHPITREIVAKVDFADYEQRLFVRKRTSELLKALDAKAAAAQKILVYQTLAKADPEMQAMLEEYTNLIGGNLNESKNV